jgi:AraC-like DNA-binding protein
MSDTRSVPLQRFQKVRTSNADELIQAGMHWLGATRIDLRNTGHFDARLNLIDLESTGLAFGATSCDIVVDHFPVDLVRLQIALKGRALTCVGGQVTELNESQFSVTSAGTPWQMVCHGGHHRLTLRLKEQTLMQKLGQLTGVRPKSDYHFDSAIAADDPQARSLLRLLTFLSNQLDEGAAALPGPVYRELEDAVQIAFLFASGHKFRDLLETPGPMPEFSLVKRLEEFIEAHWQEAITIERLVAEAGVSARSLFRAFERVRGTTPIAFAKTVRLRRARELLLSGDPAVTVTSAAAACNFANPGHFARYYREAYGEPPSVTMARGGR